VENAPFALRPGATTLGRGPHPVELSDVRYGSLDGASLFVDGGEMVGLVATRSADADAIVKVLSGRLTDDEYSGDVRIGGVGLAELDLADARAALLVEPHKADLFTGSIRSNLTAGTAKAEPEAVDGALHASCAIDVIDVHHDGLEHRVTERGASLSGGQRQRLTLARALLRATPVLVLHEPTTAVDAVTESAVAEGIAALRHDAADRTSTTLVVTCSPALLAVTDRVLLVDDGRVVASGSHQELMDREDYRVAVLR
jgi:putative ABC transport system ATP-binding protein